MFTNKYILSLALIGSVLFANAGNEDRRGSAGASELLLNPWNRSAALADANIGGVRGLDAMYLNVAGLARMDKTQLGFNWNNFWGGSGVNVSTIGFAQKIADVNAIGIGFTNYNFGEIATTTENSPEGTGAVFQPRTSIISLSYARQFSRSIFGGITAKVYNNRIFNARATGVAFDAGVIYVTGENNHMKFGINLKNVGTPLTYSGDGFAVTSIFQGATPENNFILTTEQRTARIEIPSQVNIGFTYDFIFDKTEAEESLNKLTAAACFTSNSFTSDVFRLGFEYTYGISKAVFAGRFGYSFESKQTNAVTRLTANNGIHGGISLDFGNPKSSLIGLDYSIRLSNIFTPTHFIGARITLK